MHNRRPEKKKKKHVEPDSDGAQIRLRLREGGGLGGCQKKGKNHGFLW